MMELRSAQLILDTCAVNTYLKLQHGVLMVGHLQLQGVHGCWGKSIKGRLWGDDSCGPMRVILNITDRVQIVDEITKRDSRNTGRLKSKVEISSACGRGVAKCKGASKGSSQGDNARPALFVYMPFDGDISLNSWCPCKKKRHCSCVYAFFTSRWKPRFLRKPFPSMDFKQWRSHWCYAHEITD